MTTLRRTGVRRHRALTTLCTIMLAAQLAAAATASFRPVRFPGRVFIADSAFLFTHQHNPHLSTSAPLLSPNLFLLGPLPLVPRSQCRVHVWRARRVRRCARVARGLPGHGWRARNRLLCIVSPSHHQTHLDLLPNTGPGRLRPGPRPALGDLVSRPGVSGVRRKPGVSGTLISNAPRPNSFRATPPTASCMPTASSLCARASSRPASTCCQPCRM